MGGIQGFGLFFLIGGGLFSLYSLGAVFRRWALLKQPVKVKGTVVRLIEPTHDAESGVRITPVVRYTVDGQSFERKLAEVHEEGVFKVGSKVNLLYQRGKPANVTDAECRWQDVIVHLVMGLVAVAFGMVLYFFTEVG